MHTRFNKHISAGFTLIELIIVIVILGILAVTAAPRFIDISDDAQDATTAFEAANFAAAIKLVYNAYQIRQESPIQVGNISVPIDSESQWPTGTGSGGQLCANLWSSVLETSQSITVVTNLNASLAEEWNTFGDETFCGYAKKRGELTFASGELPHFVYYIRDVSSVTINGQVYGGSAGSIQKINM